MSKKQVSIIVGIIVFAVFIAGVYFVYDKLGDSYRPDNLAPAPQQETSTSKPDKDNNEQTDTKEPESNKDETTEDKEETTNEASQEENKYAAPDFTVTDMNGKKVKLSDFKGKPVVLNFWATWCGFCVEEMPDFDRAAQVETDVQFMMVNLTGGGETVEGAKKFIEENGFTFPVFFDTENEVSYKYDTSSVPVTYFIDKDGNLATYGRGMLDAQTLKRGIEMIK